MEAQHRIQAADGVELQAWLAVPRDPRAALVLCHGLSMDSDEKGVFPRIRDRALRRGLAVARFDFRAHGQSGGSNENLRLEGTRADVAAVLELVSRELGVRLPVIPVGLSFGGAAAVHAAATAANPAGLVLWYTPADYQANYGPGSSVPYTHQMRAARDGETDPPWSAMPAPGTTFYLPNGLMDELPTDTTATTIGALPVPVLVYQGSRDDFIDIEPMRALASAHPHVELRMVPGAGHGFLLWRPWVIRQTVAWIDGRVWVHADCGAG